jgi:hypothetical protein
MTSLNEAYTYPSVVINNVTYTAKSWGQFPTITYLGGGTAGFETVTMDANFNVFVTIQDGVSTNLQIKTAILATATPDNAAVTPASLLTVAITSGHNSDVNKATSLVLSGGTPAVKASLTLQGFNFLAASAGTSANSTRVRITSGATAGSEVVTVSSQDITIQIATRSTSYTPFSYPQAGVDFSTRKQILAAYNAVGAATALAAISIVPSLEKVDAISTVGYTNLSGGLAAAAAAGTAQGVTATANATGSTANGVIVKFTPGATAGSEVVTDNADGSFTVQIQSGTSTELQIKTALNADTGFSALYTATDSSDATTVLAGLVPLTGAASQPGMGFYTDNTSTTLTTTYQYLAFDDVMSSVDIQNTDASGNNVLSISWDGINVHGLLGATQQRIFRPVNYSGVYVKYVTGSPAFKIFAVKAR